MTSKFDKMPTEEDLLGAGMAFAEATALLDRAEEKRWDVNRVWAFLLKRQSNGFPKLDQTELSAHLKAVFGDVTPADMGRP